MTRPTIIAGKPSFVHEDNPYMREPATGLAPMPLDGRDLTEVQVREIIGSRSERLAFDDRHAHGYDVDAVLAASTEFRRCVGGVPGQVMSRGEAQHIVRALIATGAPGDKGPSS